MYHILQDTHNALFQTILAASVLFIEICLSEGILFTTTSPPLFISVNYTGFSFAMQVKSDCDGIFLRVFLNVICNGATLIAHIPNSQHIKCPFSDDNRCFYTFQRTFLGEKYLLEGNPILTNTLYLFIVRFILLKYYCGDHVFFTFFVFFQLRPVLLT